MPGTRPSRSATSSRATLLRHSVGASLVSNCSQPRRGIFTGQFDACDDAATRVRDERQVALVAVERREPGARVGQANAGTKTLRKSDAVVDHGHANAFGQIFGPDGNRSS